MTPVHELSEANIEFLSVVDKGANRKRFFMRKAEGEGADAAIEMVSQRIVKAGDWSAVYCVVAEPGALEGPGMGAAEPDIDDRWADEDEIRKAAHRFMLNGGAINRMHESIDPYGQIVENAIAPADFTVTDPDGEEQTVIKGSWYVAIVPNDEGRTAVEDGTFGGVSIQGTATRTLVEKAAGAKDFGYCDEACLTRPDADEGECKLAKATGAALPSLDRSAGSNWVQQTGGLPSLIDRAAKHLHYERGRTISAAIATAVNWAKKMCASGTAFGGKVKVSGKAQAAACAAVAEWEAKKAKAKVTKRKVRKGEIAWETEEGSSAYLRSVGDVNEGLLKRIAKAVGISEDELPADVAKAATFAEMMAERELDKALPDAFNVLRDAVYRAFYPPPNDPDPRSPEDLISESLDEFKEWALDLVKQAVGKSEAELVELVGEKPEGSSEDPATVGDMSWTDEEKQRIEKIESALEGLTPEKIAEAVTKAQEEPEAPTPEELKESVEKLTEAVTKVADDVKKLGEGGSSQGGKDPVTKTEPEEEGIFV